jgi:hypothetical protein
VDANEPQGIIAIMTSRDGEVVATAADFNRSGVGGCKLWEAQMWRARDAVKWAAVKAYCSPTMANALGSYLMEQIASAMIAQGHKLTMRSIGYPNEIAVEVERR